MLQIVQLHLYSLTIELDDREDILTIEKQIMCQIFRSSQKPKGKPVRRSKQNDTKNRRFSKTAHLYITVISPQYITMMVVYQSLRSHVPALWAS